MMDCKSALQEVGGDVEKARDVLRKRGQQVADKASDRAVSEGLIYGYGHHNGKVGVAIGVNCSSDVHGKGEFDSLLKDLAMHATAHVPNPVAVDKDSVPADLVEREKKIALQTIDQDPKLSGKPDEIKQKMVDGKLRKFFEERALLEQKFVKDPSQKVSDLPMGTHRVFLVATDSDGESSDEVSIELTVQNNRPSVEIRAPGQDAEFLEGDAITLSGSGFDPDRQTFLSDANLTWFATRIGTVKRKLERGKEITVSDLTPGRYTITLVATDPDDTALTARARIRIRVKPRPAIQPVPTTTSGDSGGAIGGLNNNTGN